MTNKYYLRSIREDGFGECVIPEVTNRRENQGMRYVTQDRFDLHVSALPVSALAHPDLAKKIGWVENYELHHQELQSYGQGSVWTIITKAEYDFLEASIDPVKHRILLVEKKQEEKSEDFYCKAWQRDGAMCEEQCSSCKKAEDLPEVKYNAQEFAYQIVSRLAVNGKLDSKISAEDATNILAGAFKQFAEQSTPPVSGEPGGLQWVSVEDRPLFIKDEKGNWICTEDAEKEFIAALPYRDKKRPNENNLWWIHHCVVEDNIGLCVVGDDSNEPAGWELEDVTHWMPLPHPPKQ